MTSGNDEARKLGSFFLIPGTPEHTARQKEIADRDARHDAETRAKVAAVEEALADDTREGLRLIQLARLLDAESFRMREAAIVWAAAERARPGANDPGRQRATFLHESSGRRSVENALRKARQVMALVKSWDEEDG